MKRLLLIVCIATNSYALTVHEQLHNLSLDQKIGQLFMVAAVCDEAMNQDFMRNSPYSMDKKTIEKLITDHHVSGIIFAGTGTPDKQIERTQHYQKLSTIPLLIGQDLEWGLSMRLQNVLCFPHAMTLGAISNDALIYAMGKEVGRQAQLLGVHMNFAPVVDINNNPLNPIIHDRSFGDNPARVTQKALAFMRGLRDAGIIACAKHFPGHGNTSVDSHLTLPRIESSLAELNRCELVPFKTMIEHEVPAIMVAHLDVPALEQQQGIPTSLSYTVVTKFLKQQLGFNGLVLPDGLGMCAITNHYQPGDIELNVLLAGHDIILMPLDVPKAIQKIKNAIACKKITEQDINERVVKILAAKKWALDNNSNAFNPIYQPEAFTTPEATKLQQQLYDEALTIARDHAGLLPISSHTDITYVQYGGSQQCSFASSLQQHTSHIAFHYLSPTTTQEYDLPAITKNQLAIIALFSMNKRQHIEQSGTINKYGISQPMINLIKQLHAQGNNIILVIFGSPYSISLFDEIKTIVVAYEDHECAQKAAANLLLGKAPAQGTLPVTLH